MDSCPTCKRPYYESERAYTMAEQRQNAVRFLIINKGNFMFDPKQQGDEAYDHIVTCMRLQGIYSKSTSKADIINKLPALINLANKVMKNEIDIHEIRGGSMAKYE